MGSILAAPRRALAFIGRSAVLLALPVGFLGCDSGPPMGRVEGTVTVDGEPLSTGTIRFIPKDGGRNARGEIQSDGTFTLGTFSESDGALVGLHGVAVTAYEGEAGGGNLETDVPTRRPLVHPRYGSASGSQITFEVKPGKNVAEFDLEGY